MPCAILTETVLGAALRRQLSDDQRASVLRHLREPCEECLDLLDRWTAEEMLVAPDDLLSEDELQRLLDMLPPLAAGRPAPRAFRWDRRRPRIALGAAVALALLALVTVVRAPGRRPEDGLKGTVHPATALIPFAGVRTPTPHVVRALARGGRLGPGELLLLRISLDTPAWIYLLSQKQGEGADLLWSLPGNVPHGAGEFELAEGGSALAIDPSDLGTGGRLLLIASPEPIDARRLQLLTPLRSREELERAFPGCGVDLLPVAVEAP